MYLNAHCRQRNYINCIVYVYIIITAKKKQQSLNFDKNKAEQATKSKSARYIGALYSK